MSIGQPQYSSLMDQDAETNISMAELLRSLKQPQSNLLSADEWQTQHAPPVMAGKSSAVMSLARQYSNPIAVRQFHSICRKCGLVPVFSYTEKSQEAFNCSVECGEMFKFSLPEMFTNKKAAKHYICEKALHELWEMMQSDLQPTDGSSQIKLEDKNWMSILTTYCPQNKPNSIKLEYCVSEEEHHGENAADAESVQQVLYIAMVRLSPWPQKTFGFTTIGFPTEDAAKQNAAKEAVMFLREGDSYGGFESDIHEDGPQSMHEMSEYYGMQPPAWIETPTTSPDGSASAGWWNMAVRFMPQDQARHPALRGDVGLVGPIYGRQKAKKACAKVVLEIFEQIKMDRAMGL